MAAAEEGRQVRKAKKQKRRAQQCGRQQVRYAIAGASWDGAGMAHVHACRGSVSIGTADLPAVARMLVEVQMAERYRLLHVRRLALLWRSVAAANGCGREKIQY